MARLVATPRSRSTSRASLSVGVALLALLVPTRAGAQITIRQASPASLGASMSIQVTGAQPSSPIVLGGAFSLLDPPLAVGTVGLLYLLPPITQIPLGSTNSFGSLTASLSVPSSPGLAGFVLPIQAVDFAALPLKNGTALSNPLAAWIGPAALQTAPTPTMDAYFGYDVVFGDFLGSSAIDLAVGAHGETVSGALAAGVVYVFEGPSFSSYVTLASSAPQIGANFGRALAALDWNGDGMTDLAVGEPGHDGLSPFVDIGALHVFPHPVGSGGVSTYTDPSPVAYETTGMALAAGNLDSTPNDELVAGAPWNGGGQPANVLASVKVLAYSGGAALVSELVEPNVAGGGFGRSVAVGDVDGDGIGEVLVGEPSHSETGALFSGAAHLFAGGAFSMTLLDPAPAFGESFGVSVAIGDLDGDTLGDLLIGVLLESSAKVFHAPLFASVTPLPSPRGATDVHGGRDVLVADVNGDGKPDAVVAASSCGLPGPVCGSIFAYLGPSLATSTWIDGANGPWALTAADLDGDGRMEIAAGAWTASVGGNTSAGHVLRTP
jgi:hypothetical protein